MTELYTVAIILEILLIGFYCIFGTYFIKKRFEKDAEHKNPFFLHYGLFFLGVMVGELIYLSLMISAPDLNFRYWDGDFSIKLVYRLTFICRAIGYAFLVYRVEKNIFRESKNILTILYLILVSIGQLILLLAEQESPLLQLATLINLIGIGITIFIPIGYFNIARIGSGKIRKKALAVALAFTFLAFPTIIFSQWIIDGILVEIIFDLTPLFIINVILRMSAILFIFWGFKSTF